MERQSSLQLAAVQRPQVHVYAWGRGDLGQLGVQLTANPLPGDDSDMADGDSSQDCALTPMKLDTFEGKRITHVAAGPFNTAFLTSDGELYTCGASDSGQLGVKMHSHSNRHAAAGAQTATRVDALDVYKVLHCAYGQDHAAAVTDQGVALAWGSSEYGQLGLGPNTASQQDVPKVVKGSRSLRFARVAAGSGFSIALTYSGQVYSFGSGTFGVLGHGDEENHAVPKLIKRLWHQGIIQVSCGEYHCAALTINGRVWTWGKAKYGALGCGEPKRHSAVPQPVKALQGILIVQVVCGGDHTLALTSSGTVFAWGRNTWGQLGLGHDLQVTVPQLILGALEGQRVIQVAAGARHSAALTTTNQVLVWGCGEQGQLGNGKTIVAQLSPAPLPAPALPAVPIQFIAAGGDHTFAIMKETAQGETVTIGPSPPVMGVPVVKAAGAGTMPMPLPNLLQLAKAAKADLHAPTALPSATSQQQSGSPTVAGTTTAVSPRSPANGSGYAGSVDGLVSNAGGPMTALLQAAVENIFSSPGFLAAGFSAELSAQEEEGDDGKPAGSSCCDQVHPSDEHAAVTAALIKCGYRPHGMDINAISNVYQALLGLYLPDVVMTLRNACSSLLDTLAELLEANDNSNNNSQQDKISDALALADQPASNIHAAVLPALLVLIQNPLNAHAGSYNPAASSLWTKLARVWGLLAPAAQQVLAHWTASLPPEVFGGRVLRPLQAHIARCAERGVYRARPDILAAAQVLQHLYQAHSALVDACCSWGCTALLGGGTGPTQSPGILPLPATEWSNKALSETCNLKEEYLTYLQVKDRYNKGGMPLHSICQVPLLLTPEAKSRILQGEASVQKQHIVQNSAVSALLQGINPHVVVFLDVHVRRTHVMQDALQQILARPDDLKKPLRVTFIGPGGVPEEGLDEGGVSREFFQLLVADIFKPEYGMFVWNDETRVFDFNPSSFESDLEFRLVGAVLGLAIYNGVILDVHLPMVIYKKLLGQTPGWRDLCESQPSLARGLAALLAFDGDVENTFCRTFEVEYDFFGETRRKALLPGGENIAVTAENRLQYVQLYTKWILEGSIETQFKAFLTGFHQVCGGPALNLLSPPELELLVAGLPHLDFAALQKGARYEGGFNENTPAVKWLWETLHDMTLDQKKRFLSFTTGCDRAPVGGLGKLTLTIQKAGPDSDRLPTAHTCFNVLLMPEYADKAKLKDRLLNAIDNAQGFGLQ